MKGSGFSCKYIAGLSSDRIGSEGGGCTGET